MSDGYSTTHPVTPKDKAGMTAMRATVEPNKGRLQGVAARMPFDGIMSRVVAPTGVSFESATVTDIHWFSPAGTYNDALAAGDVATAGVGANPSGSFHLPRAMIRSMSESAQPYRFTDQYDFDADFRGETLTYIESGRRVSMTWTWSSDYQIYTDSIQSWINPDRSQSPVSVEERSEIVQRAIKYAREVQHVVLKVEP